MVEVKLNVENWRPIDFIRFFFSIKGRTWKYKLSDIILMSNTIKLFKTKGDVYNFLIKEAKNPISKTISNVHYLYALAMKERYK